MAEQATPAAGPLPAGPCWAAPERPGPTATELGAPFWAAAREHRLVRPRCVGCDRSHFPPLPACPHCLSTSWTWTASRGTGTVHSWTRLHRAPGPGFAPPYLLADVDLDDGWRMLANLWDVEDPRIGMAVRVGWLDVADGAVLPVFTGAGGPS